MLTEIDAHAPPCPPPRLSQRPDRRPVGGDCADDPRRGDRWATAQGRQARDRRGDPLRLAGGLRGAAAAARLPALADGLRLPAPVAAGGRVGARPPHAGHGRPREGGPRRLAFGRHHRQPDRQGDGSKGGCRGYDAGKRTNGCKRHIMPTPTAACLRSRSTPPMCRTATAPRAS